MIINKETKENFKNELLKLRQNAEDVVWEVDKVLRNLENVKTEEELKQVKGKSSVLFHLLNSGKK